jgi:hypothetical protein
MADATHTEPHPAILVAAEYEVRNAELEDEVERLRAAIQGALNSDLAGTEHDPEWRACRDAVMTDLRRALMPPAESDNA